MSVLLEVREELRQQTRLTRTRLAEQSHDLRLACEHAVEGSDELAQFIVTANERRFASSDVQAPRGTRNGQRCNDTVNGNGLGLALEPDLAQGFEIENMLGESVSRSARENLPRFSS